MCESVHVHVLRATYILNMNLIVIKVFNNVYSTKWSQLWRSVGFYSIHMYNNLTSQHFISKFLLLSIEHIINYKLNSVQESDVKNINRHQAC